MKVQGKEPVICQKARPLSIMLGGVTREPTHYFFCDNFYQMHSNPELLNFWGPTIGWQTVRRSKRPAGPSNGGGGLADPATRHYPHWLMHGRHVV